MRKLRNYRRWINTPAPLLGEHNKQVFAGLLGLSAGRLGEMRRNGIV